jgi:hypothetical protein
MKVEKVLNVTALFFDKILFKQPATKSISLLKKYLKLIAG